MIDQKIRRFLVIDPKVGVLGKKPRHCRPERCKDALGRRLFHRQRLLHLHPRRDLGKPEISVGECIGTCRRDPLGRGPCSTDPAQKLVNGVSRRA